MSDPTRIPGPVLVGLLLLGPLGVPGSASAQGLPSDDRCVACHLELDEERLRAPAESFEDDIHGARGFDCLSCHGRAGDGPDGLDPAGGFLARPARSEIPDLCGRCHSDAAFMRTYNPSLRVDQVTEYWTSGHGKALAARNDPSVATCVSCHPAHRTLPPNDPESTVHPLNVADLCAGCHADPEVMGDHPQGTGQSEEYRSSVHGRLLSEEGDLSAPTCNDCHGNHGAAPPGLASVRNVCGQCHATMAEFFASSDHPEYFDELDLPGCAACHGHHAVDTASDDLLVERSETVCATCHDADDPDGDAFLIMKSLIDSLLAEAEESREVLLEAENRGMEVEQAFFDLDEVGNALVKARTAIHGLRVEPVQEEVEAGLTATLTARSEGEEALYEHWFRRAGLAASAAVILGLVFALILKIRQIEVRAESLVSRVDSFFEEAVLSARAPGAPRHAEAVRLAASALLLELASTDDDFTEPELRHLEESIQRRFALRPKEARRLVEFARMERERGTDLKEFTALVSRHFTADEKREIVNAMWGLVLSDDGLAEHERHMMREITERLDLDETPVLGVGSGPGRRWLRMFFEAMGTRWREGAPDEPEDLVMAACALLVELVYADEEVVEVGRRQLERLLERRFGLSHAQTDRLLSLTEEHRTAGVDLEQLGAILRVHYTRADRERLVEAVRSLVAADETLAGRKRHVMERLHALLEPNTGGARSESTPSEASTPGGAP